MIFLALAGVAVYALVKVGKRASQSARQATARLATHVNAMGNGDAAEVERLRLDLRREVSMTRQHVDAALQQGWGLGDLPQLMRELSQQADVHDTQLGMYAQQRRVSPYVDHVTLDRLREHQAKLTAMCARIRADLLDSQVHHASTGIEELHARTELEIESRRRTVDPLDEIDELYRKTMQERRDPS
ncbi:MULTISPECIES: hypothetical protein [Nonomuraea]|uniref:Uncharacterized protein n=1 Tax=Nonomuraea dietziae TaxID=65515 RepID=A0A7W5YBR3_9ACTN|nr:hypothetical protein [Nonomuraea dietziae]MBB3732333.1 hypothetical protein [Nonomuraea dietziae]